MRIVVHGQQAFGKAVDGQKLLGLFGLLMIVIAIMTVRRKPADADRFRPLCWDNAGTIGLRLVLLGLGAGFASGFFGIGGGFLVVPGLIAATHMPLLEAVGSSLVSWLSAPNGIVVDDRRTCDVRLYCCSDLRDRVARTP